MCFSVCWFMVPVVIASWFLVHTVCCLSGFLWFCCFFSITCFLPILFSHFSANGSYPGAATRHLIPSARNDLWSSSQNIRKKERFFLGFITSSNAPVACFLHHAIQNARLANHNRIVNVRPVLIRNILSFWICFKSLNVSSISNRVL